MTRIADRSLPFGGTWTYEITAEAGGSALRITEEGEVYNVIFRFMARFVFGYTATMEGVLRDAGRRFGERCGSRLNMGQVLECRMRWGGRSLEGHLAYRRAPHSVSGEERVKIPLKDVTTVAAPRAC